MTDYKDTIDQLKQALVDRTKELEMVKRTANELQQSNAELAAQVELLRNGAQAFSFSFTNDDEEAKDISESTLCRFADLQDCIAKTPAQCLDEIRAQAGRAGFIAGINARRGIEYDVHNGDWKAADRAADEYANTIRNQKGGE